MAVCIRNLSFITKWKVMIAIKVETFRLYMIFNQWLKLRHNNKQKAFIMKIGCSQ